MPDLTDDEEAKRVLDGEGEEIGIVDEVRDGTAYVDPVEGLGALKSKLDWGTDAHDTYPLRDDAIAEITDDAIRLRDDYAME